MASSSGGDGDFFFGDDLDAILALLDEDIPVENVDFDADLDVLLEEIDSNTPAEGFSCEKCGKVCKTKRGLTRHTNATHAQAGVEAPTASKRKTPKQVLHPMLFKKFIETSVAKLASDECYSDKLRAEFSGYTVNVDDAASSFRYVRDVIGSFKGNAEKFYPEFYKCVSSEEVVFKNLSRKGSVILGFEMANHVLAHLTDATVNEGNIAFSHPVSFSSKEVNIIQYLSAYFWYMIQQESCEDNCVQFSANGEDLRRSRYIFLPQP